jgi:hypothetical protein
MYPTRHTMYLAFIPLYRGHKIGASVEGPQGS